MSNNKREQCGSDIPNDIWRDPSVMAALKGGRTPDDIMVLDCPKCSRYGYYNQGSSFWCRFCKESWRCLNGGEDSDCSRQIYLDDHSPVTLSDTITDVTDGYHNETRNP